MSTDLLNRAKAWAESSPSLEEILTAHNNLVKKILRGGVASEDAEPALDYLGDLFAESDGDVTLLLAVDIDVEKQGAVIPPSAEIDTSPLVDHGHVVTEPALSQCAKEAIFHQLKSKFGIYPNVAS